MKTSNIETRLDNALARVAGDAVDVNVASNDAEVQELIHVAQHLQLLAPVPEPQLADSQRRFLGEAMRHHTPVRGTRLLPHRARAFAFTLLVLVVASAVMLLALSAVANRQNAPIFQVTSTLTVSPTYAATPIGDFQTPDVPPKHETPSNGRTLSSAGARTMLTKTFDEPRGLR
jgi:hypothetical protein